MAELAISQHAERRAQQRGLVPTLIALVASYADLEIPVGSGRVAVRLSYRAVRRLAHERGATVADRARNVVLILAGDVLVTVLHAHGQASRRYRRRRH